MITLLEKKKIQKLKLDELKRPILIFRELGEKMIISFLKEIDYYFIPYGGVYYIRDSDVKESNIFSNATVFLQGLVASFHSKIFHTIYLLN